MITLTKPAIKQLKSALSDKPGYGLRVFVGGGGCSGMTYGMSFENEHTENDFVEEFDGVQVMVDAMSSMYLDGASIDYIDNMLSGGFKINNPNAKTTCGCGHSFKT